MSLISHLQLEYQQIFIMNDSINAWFSFSYHSQNYPEKMFSNLLQHCFHPPFIYDRKTMKILSIKLRFILHPKHRLFMMFTENEQHMQAVTHKFSTECNFIMKIVGVFSCLFIRNYSRLNWRTLESNLNDISLLLESSWKNAFFSARLLLVQPFCSLRFPSLNSLRQMSRSAFTIFWETKRFTEKEFHN